MRTRILCAIGVMAALLLVFGRTAAGQTDASVDNEINALRSDLKADKATIIEEAMQLKPEEAKAFWPVYKQYDNDMAKVNDELVQLVKTYAEKFGSISDADARDLTTKALSVQSRKIDVKKKYFPIFSKATSALTAAKFFQVDYRLELLFNMKLASELPALLVQPAQAAGKGN